MHLIIRFIPYWIMYFVIHLKTFIVSIPVVRSCTYSGSVPRPHTGPVSISEYKNPVKNNDIMTPIFCLVYSYFYFFSQFVYLYMYEIV